MFGIAGKFWRPDGSLRWLTAEEFGRFEEPGFAKAVLNVAVADDGRGATLLSTETRVLCFGARARGLFRLYWTLIERFSGLIRLELLKRVRARVAQEKGESRT